MPLVDADPPWFLDQFPAAAEPGWSGPLGPARGRYAAWLVIEAGLGEQARTAQAEIADAIKLALTQGFVLTRLQALKCGLDAAQLRRLVRRGAWTSPRLGVLCVLGRDHPEAGSGEIAAAATVVVHPGAVISHCSATTMHGLPQLRAAPRPILTRAHRSFAGGRADVLLHACRLTEPETVKWFGAPVTDVARTVIDTSRGEGVKAGLVLADAALAERLVTCDELGAAVINAAGRPGLRRAERVVELADARAESPLESLTRLCLIEGGLIDMEPQSWIETNRGRFRVDLLIGSTVIVEADGRTKYQGDSDALWREKLRQEALEQAGYSVVRVTWDEVMRHPDQVIARVNAALAGIRPPAVGGW